MRSFLSGILIIAGCIFFFRIAGSPAFAADCGRFRTFADFRAGIGAASAVTGDFTVMKGAAEGFFEDPGGMTFSRHVEVAVEAFKNTSHQQEHNAQ